LCMHIVYLYTCYVYYVWYWPVLVRAIDGGTTPVSCLVRAINVGTAELL
jgi:hypothetical protein